LRTIVDLTEYIFIFTNQHPPLLLQMWAILVMWAKLVILTKLVSSDISPVFMGWYRSLAAPHAFPSFCQEEPGIFRRGEGV
jgi:hypothetical protein